MHHSPFYYVKFWYYSLKTNFSLEGIRVNSYVFYFDCKHSYTLWSFTICPKLPLLKIFNKKKVKVFAWAANFVKLRLKMEYHFFSRPRFISPRFKKDSESHLHGSSIKKLQEIFWEEMLVAGRGSFSLKPANLIEVVDQITLLVSSQNRKIWVKFRKCNGCFSWVGFVTSIREVGFGWKSTSTLIRLTNCLHVD